MAGHSAAISGTEKNRLNCRFYSKMGVCRDGERCSRLHNRPTRSPTLLFSNMYQRPDLAKAEFDPQKQPIDPGREQQHFEDFFEDIYEELCKYGKLERLNVCDNLEEYMVGNVYVQFRDEEQAGAAKQALTGRFYAHRPIVVDFSPATDFRNTTCCQYEVNDTCDQDGYCNYLHLKKISKDLRHQLFGSSESIEMCRNTRRRPGRRNRSPTLRRNVS